MTTRSTPERLDEAVESLLAGERPVIEPELRPLLQTATTLSRALRPVPAGPRFEAQLAERLTAGPVSRAAGGLASFTRRELGRPGRLLAAGAFSSVAVGATVTAYAVWRSSRRTATLQHRLLQR
jgi:hypothetical protein